MMISTASRWINILLPPIIALQLFLITYGVGLNSADPLSIIILGITYFICIRAFALHLHGKRKDGTQDRNLAVKFLAYVLGIFIAISILTAGIFIYMARLWGSEGWEFFALFALTRIGVIFLSVLILFFAIITKSVDSQPQIDSVPKEVSVKSSKRSIFLSVAMIITFVILAILVEPRIESCKNDYCREPIFYKNPEICQQGDYPIHQCVTATAIRFHDPSFCENVSEHNIDSSFFAQEGSIEENIQAEIQSCKGWVERYKGGTTYSGNDPPWAYNFYEENSKINLGLLQEESLEKALDAQQEEKKDASQGGAIESFSIVTPETWGTFSAHPHLPGDAVTSFYIFSTLYENFSYPLDSGKNVDITLREYDEDMNRFEEICDQPLGYECLHKINLDLLEQKEEISQSSNITSEGIPITQTDSFDAPSGYVIRQYRFYTPTQRVDIRALYALHIYDEEYKNRVAAGEQPSISLLAQEDLGDALQDPINRLLKMYPEENDMHTYFQEVDELIQSIKIK